MADGKFRTRYRFRTAKRFNIEGTNLAIAVAGRDVVLTARSHGVPIRESEWLVLRSDGFETEQAAYAFGVCLKIASEISSVATRLGIDSGLDRPTGQFSDQVKQRVLQKTGEILRNDVHGVDAYPE